MMNFKLPLLLTSLLPIGIATALPSRGQELSNATPVRWEPVVRSTALDHIDLEAFNPT